MKHLEAVFTQPGPTTDLGGTDSPSEGNTGIPLGFFRLEYFCKGKGLGRKRDGQWLGGKERLPEPRSGPPGVGRRDVTQARRMRQTCVQGTGCDTLPIVGHL